MGLFDIFKKAEKVEPIKAKESVQAKPVQEEPVKEVSVQPESVAKAADTAIPDGYAGDLKKTEVIEMLLSQPVESRTAEWMAQFLLNLPLASFRCGTPQVMSGPDGFPYFRLFVPAPGEEFQSYVIDKMIPDFLLERGYGIVINPGEGQPDWILSYGDLLNYFLNGSFFKPEDNLFGNRNIPEEVGKGEEITIGQPSDGVLPAQTRKLLKDFFELNGIEDPKVLLMMRRNGEEVSQDLAFNITPEYFESDIQYRNMMQTVTWYLPRHYSILGLQDENVENGFMTL